MADNIKGITIEFRGNATPLQKAIRTVNTEISKTTKELSSVNKALKFNPTSVELWRQKQDLLKQKISETADKLDVLKQQQKQYDAANVDKNSEAYRKLEREIIETSSQLKTFERQLRQVGNVNLRVVSEQFKVMGDKLTAAGNAMRGVSMAAGAVAASYAALTTKSAKWADDVVTASKVYSMSTAELQKYNAAAELVDVSAEAIAKTHRKLERNMLNAQLGSKKQALAFEELGVSYKNADGSLRDGDAVWQDTIEALSKMTNETERDAYAMALMGRSATELNPLIEDGAEGYKLLTEAMEKYDLEFVDEETLQRANDFNDLLDVTKAVGMIAFQQLGTQLAAYLAPAMEKVVDVVGKLAKWFSELSPRTQAIIASIAAVIAVIGPLLIIVGKVAFAISSIMGLMSTLGLTFTMLAGPIGIVIAIIAALVAAFVVWKKYGDQIKEWAVGLKVTIIQEFTQIRNSVLTVWNNIKTFLSNIWAGIKATASSAWEGVKAAIVSPIQSAFNLVKIAIDKIKSLFPLKVGKIFSDLKIPHIKVSGGKAPYGIGGKGSVPSINVDWYAQGGIFRTPTIFPWAGVGVGDASSPEAVLPISKLQEMVDFGNKPGLEIMEQQTAILVAIYEELQKEKNFMVDNIWAGRYVNSLVK